MSAALSRHGTYPKKDKGFVKSAVPRPWKPCRNGLCISLSGVNIELRSRAIFERLRGSYPCTCLDFSQPESKI